MSLQILDFCITRVKRHLFPDFQEQFRQQGLEELPQHSQESSEQV